MSRFARKRALATLRNAAVLLALVLTSWLVATTCFAALDLPDIAADASRYREQITGGRDTGEGVAVRLHAAKEALEAQRWLPAIKALEALLLRVPDDPQPWLRLARAWREHDPKAAELSAPAYNAYLSARRTGVSDDGAASEALLLIAQQLERQHGRELAIRTWAEVGRLVSDPTLEQRLAQQSTASNEFKMADAPKVRADAQAPSLCAEFTAPLDAVQPSRYRECV